MKIIEYKEGIITYGGHKASSQLQSSVFAISVISEKNISEACDLLNQFMQLFEDALTIVIEILRILEEKFRETSQDICEPCKYRGTRHDSNIEQAVLKQAEANIKWQEKYRPP